MKKLFMILVCIFLLGCQKQKQEETSVEVFSNGSWMGIYRCGDIRLEIIDENKEEIEYTIEVNVNGLGRRATFINENEAIDMTYSLHFIKNNDSIIVEETGEKTDLGVNLSGEYKKE